MSIEIGDGGLGYIYLGDVLIAGKGESGWKPGANTIAYYPLNGNVNDASGNGYNGTRQGTSHYETLASGLQVASFPKDTSQVNYISSSLNTEPKTVSFWVKQDNYVSWSSLIGMVNTENGHWQLRFTDTSGTYYIKFYGGETNLAQVSIIGSWTNIVLTMDNGTVNLYANGVLKGTLTGQTTSPSGTLYIGGNRYGWNNTNKRNLEGYMSDVILESVVWTATEITKYYNQTKDKYQGGVRTYEFDFTDSTGWTLTNATISNGKLQGTANDCKGTYDMGDITQANKITIDATVYGTTGSWVGIIWARFENATDNVYTGVCANYMTNSGYQQSCLKLGQAEAYNTDTLISTTTKYGNGAEMPVHGELDLVNKTATFSMNDTVIGTTTITDAQISNFRSHSNGSFALNLSKNNWYVSYLKVKIEF